MAYQVGDNMAGGNQNYDGYTIVPFNIPGSYSIVSTQNRDIKLLVRSIEIMVDTVTFTLREDIKPAHSTAYAEPHALVGGDIDVEGNFEVQTWIEGGGADVILQNLRESSEGRAIYFDIQIDYKGDPAKEGEGQHMLFRIEKCKLKDNGATFNQGAINKTRYTFQATRCIWYGR